MKKLLSVLLVLALVAGSTHYAVSRSSKGSELSYFGIPGLGTLLAASIASGDFVPVYDASAGVVKKVDATALPLGGAFNGTVGAITPAAGVFTTIDGTDLEILTGDLTVGNGTPGVTQDGEDAYIEGTLEVDGASEFDGAVDFDSTITIGTTSMTASGAELNYNDIATLGTLAASKAWTSDASLDTIMPTGGLLTVQSGGGITLNSGSALISGGVTVNQAPLQAQARGTITICGDATTVNNNTVYYGPSQVLTSSATIGAVVCDTTAAGNVTEATADAPALPATAFYPLGMICWQPDSGNTITYTLRSAAAAITPAISVSIADNILAGSAAATATTAVASGATLAVAVASSGDIGTLPFRCDIAIAY